MWLLLTGFATTKLLILIASPLLAATFIFGDTCKTFFQGIMFVYVVHPIHVGDFCSIDDKKLVVKAVGVWTTTFCKIEKLGTREVVTYPNSELATKIVINNLSDFVWDDILEITLGYFPLSSDLMNLKEKIETYLKEEDEKDMSNSHSLTVPEEDDKLVIKLKYKIGKIQDWSYFKCASRKDNIMVALDKLVQEFKEEQKPST